MLRDVLAPFLRRDLPAVGRVLYPGAIPPPLDQVAVLQPPVTWTAAPTAPEQLWAVRATHPSWGAADIVCDRQPVPLPSELIDHAYQLSADEKRRARTGASTIAVRIHAHHKYVLRDRKRLLFWLRALMQPHGAVAVDGSSTLLWSEAMLDDELAHAADLDIESLYAIHAVQDPERGGRVSWLHTHGLEELDAFDVDVLEPSPLVASNCAEPLRSLAFAGLEGTITPDTERFEFAHPGGVLRFVPVDRFHAFAADRHQKLRNLDSSHAGRRAVLCDPVGGLIARWRGRPVPSRFLSQLKDDNVVFMFSTAVTELMAERARQTIAVFGALRSEFESLGLPALVKLGFEMDGDEPSNREHLWFEVHGIEGDTVDATLANTPHHVSYLTAGQRSEHSLERLTDWTVLSPEGTMSPRNISAARRLRETREEWQARIDQERSTR